MLDSAIRGLWPYGGLVVLLLLVLLVARAVCEHLVIGSRQWLEAVPSEDHAPSPEAVEAVWSSVGQAARRSLLGWFTRRADTEMVSWRLESRGRVSWFIGSPKRAVGGVRSAFQAFGGSVAVRPASATLLPWNAFLPLPEVPLAPRPTRKKGMPSPTLDLPQIPDEPNEEWAPVPAVNSEPLSPDEVVGQYQGKRSSTAVVETPEPPELLEPEDDPGAEGAPLPGAVVPGTAEAELAAEAAAAGVTPEALLAARPVPRVFRRRRYLRVVGDPADTLRLLRSFEAVPAQLAGTMSSLTPGLGDDAQLTVLLRPLSYLEARRARAKAARAIEAELAPKESAGSGLGSALRGQLGQMGAAVNSQGGGSSPSAVTLGFVRSTPSETVRAELAADRSRLKAHSTFFHVSILLVVQSTNKDVAANALNALANALAPMAETAHFKGSWFANLPGRARLFDRRLRTGLMGRTSHPVSAYELGSLLTPAPGAADHPGIRRGAPLRPVANDVEEYLGAATPHLLPGLKTVTAGSRQVVTGTPLHGMTHGYGSGRSGSGKTETILSRLVHLANFTDWGVGMIDPQGQAIQNLLPYLTDAGRRVYLMDLRYQMQPSWAPLDMSDRIADESDDVVASLVDAVSNAMEWNTRAQRARTILDQTLQLLVATNVMLCAEGMPQLQTTLLDVPAVLTDETFRKTLLDHAPEMLQPYWRDRFDRIPPDAFPVVTNPFDFLPGRYSPRGTLLGQSQGSYSAKRALAEGAVVLLGIKGTSGHSRLLANLFTFDMFREALGRTVGPHFYQAIDEAQVVDTRGNEALATSLEMLRQWRYHLDLYNQAPSALTDRTFGALMTNKTTVRTGPIRDSDAGLMSRELGGIAAAAVRDLDPYTWIMQDDDSDGHRRPAYFGTGVRPSDLMDGRPEKVPELVRQINSDTDRKTRAQVADGMASHLPDLTAWLDTKKRKRSHVARDHAHRETAGFPGKQR